jgi:hypothetical protein
MDQNSLDTEKLARASDDLDICRINIALTSEISQACWPPAPPNDASLDKSVPGSLHLYRTSGPLTRGHSS